MHRFWPSLLDPDPDAIAGVTEIIVTARKREESLQDVPLSIADAQMPTQLQGRGLLSDYDIANFTVGFRTLQQTGSRYRPADDSRHGRTGEPR